MQRRQNHIRITRKNRDQLSQQYIEQNNRDLDINSFKRWVLEFYVNQYLASRVILARHKRNQITTVLNQLENRDFNTVKELLDADNSALKNALFGRRIFRRSRTNSWGKYQILLHFLNPESNAIEAMKRNEAEKREQEKQREIAAQIEREEQARFQAEQAKIAEEESKADDLRKAQAAEQARLAAENEVKLRAEAELRQQQEIKRAAEAELKKQEEADRKAKLTQTIKTHAALYLAHLKKDRECELLISRIDEIGYQDNLLNKGLEWLGLTWYCELVEVKNLFDNAKQQVKTNYKIIKNQHIYVDSVLSTISDMEANLDILEKLDYNAILSTLKNIEDRLKAVYDIYSRNYHIYKNNSQKISRALAELDRSYKMATRTPVCDYSTEVNRITTSLILKTIDNPKYIEFCLQTDKVDQALKIIQAYHSDNLEFIEIRADLIYILKQEFEVYESLIKLLPLAEDSTTLTQIYREDRNTKDFRRDNIDGLESKFYGSGTVDGIKANIAIIEGLLIDGFAIYPEINTHYQEARRIADELIKMQKAKSDKLDVCTAAFVESCRGDSLLLIKALNEYAAHQRLLFTNKSTPDNVKLGASSGKDDQPPSPKQPPLEPIYMFVHVRHQSKKDKTPPTNPILLYSDMFKWCLFNRVIDAVNARANNKYITRESMIDELERLTRARELSFESLVSSLVSKVTEEARLANEEKSKNKQEKRIALFA